MVLWVRVADFRAHHNIVIPTYLTQLSALQTIFGSNKKVITKETHICISDYIVSQKKTDQQYSARNFDKCVVVFFASNDMNVILS